MLAPNDSFEGPLAAVGQLLAERGLRYELLAIGGGALQLLGLITRPTRDIDVVALVDGSKLVPVATLPLPLERAVDDTAGVFRLPKGWLNAGPRSLMDLGLPERMLERAHRHFDDLRRLEPTVDELQAAASWSRTHDPSEGFREELRRALRDLGLVDGDA